MTQLREQRPGAFDRAHARSWPAWFSCAVVALSLLACPSFGDGDADSIRAATETDTSELVKNVAIAPAGAQEAATTLGAIPFRPGESLRFSVQYGFINAGSAWLEVQQASAPSGGVAYELVARAESNAFFSKFYKVRNKIQSLWDRDGRFSWRYSEDRREGKFRAKSEIRFDPERHEAIYPDGESYPVPPTVQDALSSFYYTRTQPLPLGGSVVFDYHASRRSQPLEVRVLGRETVDTPAGKFNCIVVEPLLKVGGIFKSKGRLVIWLTDDERRMPVLMKSKVAVGSISVVLQEAKPGSGI